MTDGLLRDAAAVLQPGFEGLTAPDWIRRRVAEGLGAVALYPRNIDGAAQVATLTATLLADNPDLLLVTDEEGGDVTRLETTTGSSYPGNHALGAVDDVALTEAVAAAIGADLAAAGLNLDYGPVADVNSNPRNPVIGVRSFGAEAELTARHTAAYVTGLQSAGVAACAKHFPGHGDTSVDSHHGLPTDDSDIEALRAGPLRPFEAAIAAGVKAIMTAHILLPAFDSVPATMSAPILGKLLREELGFEGLIITDGIDMGAIVQGWGLAEGTVRAVIAGADAICVGGGPSDEGTYLLLRDALVAAVRERRLPEERLHEAAERVRALGAWTREGRTARGAGTPGDRAVGLAAARRAIAADSRPRGGGFEPPAAPPLVVQLLTAANIAVGERTPWGVTPLLETLLPGTTGIRAGAEADVSDILARAAGRPLVVVVRDGGRVEWMGAVARALVAARPDATVVEMGLPSPTIMGLADLGASVLATHGASLASARAAAETLAGKPMEER